MMFKIHFDWKTSMMGGQQKINAITNNAFNFQIRKMHIKKPAFGTKL